MRELSIAYPGSRGRGLRKQDATRRGSGRQEMDRNCNFPCLLVLEESVTDVPRLICYRCPRPLKASTVVIVRKLALMIGTSQDSTRLLSRSTTQPPQRPSPQRCHDPVPVKSSRSASRIERSGSVMMRLVDPFIVTVTVTSIVVLCASVSS